MKRIFFEMICLLMPYMLSAQNQQQTVDSFYQLSPIEIRSVRAADLAPFTKTNIRKKEIEKMNLGQDIPFLLNQTPGVVINSDAGNGIGYTGIRIRGTDASRINITLNGIPFNDAESQGSFFVDLPDFSSSTGSIQVQRGVGTSSNGAGAFGASINLSTNEINKVAYAELNNSSGSFNSWKNTLKAGTGLLDNHFTADMRLSSITSDGYIDRAFSKLKSLQFSMAYINRKNSLRLNIFSGNEKTYQAWNGITEADLKAGKRKTNYAGTEKTGEPYNNEIDQYEQNHYQLFFTHQFSKRVDF
ncbi:MAG TPA: TonB-dependent receptor plug domain-containing protein, partial [Chitinophagaceae bacterium]|nr:TonB-dependent receptor plug domain-containing protein [Chitinophagaceae bacterium]